MSDALTVVAAVGGGLAGLGGVVAAAYYGVRLADLLRERLGRVSVQVLAWDIGRSTFPDYVKAYVRLRVYNPKATARSITEVRLSMRHGEVILTPVWKRGSEYLETGGIPIELPPKRHTPLTLGSDVREAAIHERAKREKHLLDLDLDDGSSVASKPFYWNIDWKEALG